MRLLANVRNRAPSGGLIAVSMALSACQTSIPLDLHGLKPASIVLRGFDDPTRYGADAPGGGNLALIAVSDGVNLRMRDEHLHLGTELRNKIADALTRGGLHILPDATPNEPDA